MRLERREERSYRVFGYVRVSTKEQNEARQLIAMRNQGVPGKNIYVDKQSGKDFERTQYRRLMRKLKDGDTLVVKSIDRLGRNYEEILEQWRVITKEKRAAIVVLDMPLLDTRSTSGHGVTGKLIADIVLELLSYVAHVERDNIRQRQAEGIAAARARGVKLGRPALAVPEEFDAVHRMWEDGSLNSRQAAESLGVSHTTFLKWVKQRPADVTISHK